MKSSILINKTKINIYTKKNKIIKKRIICLFGLPGTGKSTIAEQLCLEFGFKHIELGKQLRELALNKNKIGIKANNIIKDGLPIDKELLEYLFCKIKFQQNIIFDGFPRDIYQYKILMEYFKYNYIIGVFLNYPLYLSINRLKTRKVCIYCGSTFTYENKCRKCNALAFKRNDDSSRLTVSKRIKNFYRATCKFP